MSESLHRFRALTIALILSGALNISLGAALYVSNSNQGHELSGPVRLASKREEPASCVAEIEKYRTLSFRELVALLTNRTQVSEGYAKRDLALSALVAFHEFDYERALGPSEVERRSVTLGDKREVLLFPGLTDERFQAVLQFAYLEKWPLTPKGLWGCLKRMPHDPTLEEALVATAPVSQIALLFQKTGAILSRAELMALISEGPWELADHFAREQAQMLDLSVEKRERFLLSYLAYSSVTAARLLVRFSMPFVLKRLDDRGLLDLLAIVPKTEEMRPLCLSLLQSPRSDALREECAMMLYQIAGETPPKPYDYESALARFAPVEKRETPPVLAVSPPKKMGREHVVKEGENLWKIARQYRVKVDDLIRYNGLEKDRLRPGMVIRVPDPLRPDETGGI